MNALKISIIVGSVRPNRMGLRVGKYLAAQLAQQGVKQVHLIDPAPLNIPLLVNRYDSLTDAEKTPELQELHAKIAESDAYIVVSPEYNHSYSPIITNVMDYFYHNEYYFKSAGIVTYSMGAFGGVRAAGPIRPFLGQMGLTSIPQTLAVPVVQSLLGEDGELLDSATSATLASNTSKFLSELTWFADALKTAREKSRP
ncbi:NADPH-dependent FMN reductase [Achlya hypogyna]|uniref:NADPH-dependent FMN reductase n=1 Tax=Achlya hypogyna TaxID=1202772 RepID=A0A1V9YZU3_ACHHY|nr:NADPH-dependent FMN reductase [Achlya hypogyna]